MTAIGIVIELNPNSLDIGKSFSHEGGMDIRCAKSLFQWLKNNGLNTPGYDGHNPYDPSGRKAIKQEGIYDANRRRNPIDK